MTAITVQIATRASPAPRGMVAPTDVHRPLDRLCGTCAGWRQIWCPGCCGFAGCAQCAYNYKVPCPSCAGGDAEPIRW